MNEKQILLTEEHLNEILSCLGVMLAVEGEGDSPRHRRGRSETLFLLRGNPGGVHAAGRVHYHS